MAQRLLIIDHAISALLDTNPDFIDVSLDMANAFDSLSRSAFMPIVRTHLPDLYPWVSSMYESSTSLYFCATSRTLTSPPQPYSLRQVHAKGAH